MIILGIVGSRYHNDYETFEGHVLKWIEVNGKPDLIISGGALGADALAKRFATKHNYEFFEYPAQWSTYGKAAGPMRNQQIVDRVTHMIAFPLDGPGTKDVLKRMDIAHKPYSIIKMSLAKKRKEPDAGLEERDAAVKQDTC